MRGLLPKIYVNTLLSSCSSFRFNCSTVTKMNKRNVNLMNFVYKNLLTHISLIVPIFLTTCWSILLFSFICEEKVCKQKWNEFGSDSSCVTIYLKKWINLSRSFCLVFLLTTPQRPKELAITFALAYGMFYGAKH